MYDEYQEGMNESITGANNTDVICCRGWETLVYSPNLVSNDYIICSGHGSCTESDFISADVLYCAGSGSCSNYLSRTPIINVSGTVYCLGMASCSLQNIYNSEIVYVGGTNAIWRANLYGIGKLIVAARHYSGYECNVCSNGVDTHMILLTTTQSGDFVCNVSDTCRIDCLIKIVFFG